MGWCLEVVFHTIRTLKFRNSGFLNGPYCPIYGFSLIAVLMLAAPFKANILIVFIGAIILTTIVEFIAGYLLEKIFNKKWWDYDNEPFNIKGYICLRASIIWGLGSVLAIYILQPVILYSIYSFSGNAGMIIALLLIFLVSLDLVVTILSLVTIKQRVSLLDKYAARVRRLSEAIGKNIHDDAIKIANIDDDNLYKNIFGHNRISTAFPKLNLKVIKRKIKSK